MKVLLINTFYNFESTGKLMHNFRNYLVNRGIETLMLFGHGNSEEPGIVRISSDSEGKIHNLLGRVTGMNGCFSPAATNRAIRLIEEFQPDIAYLGNLHGHYINIYKLYDALRRMNIPIVQLMWDEYMMTGACAFSYDCEHFKDSCHDCPHKKDYPISWFFDTSSVLQKKKENAYRNQKICFAGVPYTAQKAGTSSLLKGYPIRSVDEAVDQKNIFYPRDASALRKKHGITDDKKIILNVCPYPSVRKGGAYYLELARKCLDCSDLVFIHVGFRGDTSECPANFIPVGYVKDQDLLAEYYSLADLFVCTSFAETQPNTCLEAMSCGTPICGFNISGIPTCADAPIGKYVTPKDTDALKEIVLQAERKTEDSIRTVRSYAQSRFDSEHYNQRLLEIGRELLSENETSAKS